MPERNTDVLPAEQVRKLVAESVRPDPAAQFSGIKVELFLIAAAVVMAMLIF